MIDKSINKKDKIVVAYPLASIFLNFYDALLLLIKSESQPIIVIKSITNNPRRPTVDPTSLKKGQVHSSKRETHNKSNIKEYTKSMNNFIISIYPN